MLMSDGEGGIDWNEFHEMEEEMHAAANRKSTKHPIRELEASTAERQAWLVATQIAEHLLTVTKEVHGYLCGKPGDPAKRYLLVQLATRTENFMSEALSRRSERMNKRKDMVSIGGRNNRRLIERPKKRKR